MKAEPQKNTSPDSAIDPAIVPATTSPSYWAVLRNRDYALLFWGYLISSADTHMQIVAVAWQVYELTHSAVALGVIGLLQAIPRMLFSLVGGVFADVLDRRKMMLAIEIAMSSASVVLALCTHLHVINIWIIYVVVLFS